MISRFTSYPPARPFFSPLDFRTPMARIDFWLFYLGFMIVSSLSIVALVPVLPQDSNIPGEVAALPLLTGLLGMLWILYLFAALLSATARRMVDSGYRRIILLISLLLGFATIAFLTSLTMDMLEARQQVIPGTVDEINISFPAPYIWLAGLTMISLIYVFLGTIRPRKKIGQKTGKITQ